MEATVGTNELRSYGCKQYERHGDPNLSKTISFGHFSDRQWCGMTHKTNCHLLNIQSHSRETTGAHRGDVAASVLIHLKFNII